MTDKDPRELVVALVEIAETLEMMASNINQTAQAIRELAAEVHSNIIIDHLRSGMAPNIAGGVIPEVMGADADGEGGKVTGEFSMKDLAEDGSQS